MSSPVERWSQRFRARVDAVVAARAGSPSELYARELDTTLLLAWCSVGVAVLMAVSAVVFSVSWWASAAVGGAAASFALARRRARRRSRSNSQ